MQPIQFKTKISKGEYIKLIFLLTYRKGWIVLITAIGILFLLHLTLQHFGLIPNYFDDGKFPIINMVFGFLAVFILPISIYFSAKKTYLANRHLHEDIEYQISKDYFKQTGPHFSAELTWDRLYKIEELNKWFLIYPSDRIANFLPKKTLTGEEVQMIRSFLKTIKPLK